MVTIQTIAKIAQLSHLQDQLIALAIELNVDKDEFVQEVATGWDKQLEAYKVVLTRVKTAEGVAKLLKETSNGN